MGAKTYRRNSTSNHPVNLDDMNNRIRQFSADVRKTKIRAGMYFMPKRTPAPDPNIRYQEPVMDYEIEN